MAVSQYPFIIWHFLLGKKDFKELTLASQANMAKDALQPHKA